MERYIKENIDTNKSRLLYKNYSRAIMANDNELIAVAERSVIIYEFPIMKEIIRFKEIKNPIHLCFSQDNSLLAVKSTTGSIGVFNIRKRLFIRKIKPKNKAGGGSNILFTTDNEYLIDGDWNGNIRFINLETGTISILEKNENMMISNIQYDEVNQIFHIQKFYRGGYMDRSYSVISMWKYDSEKKEIICGGSTNRIYKHNSKLSYDSRTQRYWTISYNNSPSRHREINVYDDKLERILYTKVINNKVMDDTDYSTVTNKGEYFVTVFDKMLSVYRLSDLELVKEAVLSSTDFFSISNDDTYILITDCSLERQYFCEIRLEPLLQ